jgi:hypothetical protein
MTMDKNSDGTHSPGASIITEVTSEGDRAASEMNDGGISATGKEYRSLLI